KQGYGQLTQPYQSEIGQQVIDSFNPETYPGDKNPVLDLGVHIGTDVATSLVAGRMFKAAHEADITIGQGLASKIEPVTTKSGELVQEHGSRTVLNGCLVLSSLCYRPEMGPPDDYISHRKGLYKVEQGIEIKQAEENQAVIIRGGLK